MTDKIDTTILDRIDALENKLSIRFDTLDQKYPSIGEFRTVQIICFSFVGAIALAVLNNWLSKSFNNDTTTYIPLITPMIQSVGQTLANIR